MKILSELTNGRPFKIALKGNKNINKRKIESKIKEIRKDDISNEIWIIIDKNNRTDSQLAEIYGLEKEHVKLMVATSNPCFEI